MTARVAMPARPRLLAAPGAVLLVLALGLLMASCSSFGGAVDTENALSDNGFSATSVDFSTSDGFDEVEVTTDPGSLEGDGDSLAELAAGVVWTNFPLQFDDLHIVLTGDFEGYETFYTYDELYELFGSRPAGFDERSIGDDFARSGLIAAVVVGVGLLVFVAVAVVVVILIVRSRKRRGAPVPPPWPPRSGASQWPPGPPPQTSQTQTPPQPQPPPQPPPAPQPSPAGPGSWAQPGPSVPQPPSETPPVPPAPPDRPAGPGTWEAPPPE